MYYKINTTQFDFFICTTTVSQNIYPPIGLFCLHNRFITKYTPPIGRLDRFHISLRYHPSAVIPTVSVNAPQTNPNFAPIVFGGSVEHAFTFEIEYLDNGFNEFSTFETRLDAVNYVR